MRARAVLLALAAGVLAAAQAWGQEPRARGTSPGLWSTTTGGPTTLQESGPPVTAYPAELLGLLGPPAERGPITIRPSIAVSEEYNDNVDLDNTNRRWDLITRISPSLTLTVNRPAYQLSAGYTLSGEVYAKGTSDNDPAKSHAFVGTGLYRGIQGVTLTASDTFSLNKSNNRVGAQGFATGEEKSWNNTFTPGVTWEMTPRDTLSLSGTLSVYRTLGSGSDSETNGTGSGTDSASDSNTYGLQATLEHVMTRRLTGTAGYNLTYADFLGEGDNSLTHNPTLGFEYVVTPALTASLSAGPAITQLAGETSLSWAGSARILYMFQIGSASLDYTRAVQAVGGLGGSNYTDTYSGSLVLPTWQRGLVLAFTPSYSIAKAVSRDDPSQSNTKALSIPLVVNYQLARFVSVFAEYVFFQQRSGAGSPDVDQHRLRFGVQFGYPFNFD